MIQAHPHYFGGALHLAGWYTEPGAATPVHDTAILICPPVGHEYMCSRRALRWLANDLSERGFCVFRFDYYGTGDSGGDQGVESLVPTWLQSIELAADELLKLSGCKRLSMLGLRLGATMSAHVAAKRQDVDSLVLWSACTNGRAFVRQMRMLGMAAASRTDHLTPEADGVEAIGFMLNSATVADVSRMKLDVMSFGTVKDALVLTPDDVGSDEGLIAVMTAGGVNTEESMFPDYGRFMIAPTDSELPVAAMATIADWYAGTHQSTLPISRPTEPSAAGSRYCASATIGDDVRETAVTFSRGRLAGVLIEPVGIAGRPGVILLNSGCDHHVGPHRMYVPLARKWAALGFSVLRIDIAGLGDSDLDPTQIRGNPYPATGLPDVHDAVMFMREERGCRSVILIGMCSGAYHAIHGMDQFITAVIAVNAPLFHHAGDPILPDPFYNNHAETARVARSILKPDKWRRLLRGQVDVKYISQVFLHRVSDAAAEIGDSARKLMNRREAAKRDPVKLFRDGVATHLIFNRNDKAQVFFDRKIAPRIGPLMRRNDFSVDVVDGADHTFMPLMWQRVLSELMTEHLMKHRPDQVALDLATRESVAQI